MQFSFTEGLPSHLPLYCSLTVFERVFVLVPSPHVVEQSPIVQLPHSQLTMNKIWNHAKVKVIKLSLNDNELDNYLRTLKIIAISPGQWPNVQLSEILEDPSHDPPFFSSTSFILVLDINPCPHVFEHVPAFH